MTLIAVGSSAGGPAALAALLSGLPRDLPAAIVLVQHLDENMAGNLAEYLRQHSAVPVRVATEGERIIPGTALLAGTNDHLVLKARDRVGYTSEPVNCVYRPSVDAFFDSVTRYWKGDVIGVVLTGMGRDGAAGLRRLRDAGRHTIAQDQQSSVVYGMPKAAAAMDAAVEVLPLDQIASRLVSLVAANLV
jgi:two-component system, chemotaxis family, response regulator WspF